MMNVDKLVLVWCGFAADLANSMVCWYVDSHNVISTSWIEVKKNRLMGV